LITKIITIAVTIIIVASAARYSLSGLILLLL
jgi:hypothetical protein